jgi:thiosulfate dehydrogenase [quinone] large subunit
MSTSDRIARREFVAKCSACAAILLTGCASLVTHPVPLRAGRARVSLAAFPELARAGGTIRILPDGMTDPIYVLARDGGEFGALSPICTHRGCTVDVSRDRLVCPCHGSTYDRDGKVLKGPAQRALTRYPVTRSGDELIIEVAQ